MLKNSRNLMFSSLIDAVTQRMSSTAACIATVSRPIIVVVTAGSLEHLHAPRLIVTPAPRRKLSSVFETMAQRCQHVGP